MISPLGAFQRIRIASVRGVLTEVMVAKTGRQLLGRAQDLVRLDQVENGVGQTAIAAKLGHATLGVPRPYALLTKPAAQSIPLSDIVDTQAVLAAIVGLYRLKCFTRSLKKSPGNLVNAGWRK